MAELYHNYLKRLLGNQTKHNTGHALDVVPFLTHRTGRIKGNFNHVLGEFVRRICDLKLDYSEIAPPGYTFSREQNEQDEDNDNNLLISHLLSQVKVRNGDDEHALYRFLSEYIFQNESIKIIHPYMYNYIKVDKSDKNEFTKYGDFMRDILITDKDKFKEVFSNDQIDDILTHLLINQKNVLQERGPSKRSYSSLLPLITELYEEDLLYLSNYKDYFIHSFSLISHFYVFMYISQLVFKFSSFTKANYNELEPLYFTLDWEQLSRRRKAVEDLNSFKFILSKLDYFFPHIHTLSQLSHNKANVKEYELGTSKKIEVLTYSKMKELLETKVLDEHDFLIELRTWMVDYTEIFRKEFKEEYTPEFTDIDGAFEELFHLVDRGTSDTVSQKFGRNYEDLGANQFIKSRGSIGRVFNITHEFLLLLTAVSVKKERIPLNQLFAEYEKRGVLLDHYSKSEVVYTLDKLNLIDKKSDSGDAQYVKPVL
ncbi:MAG: DNA phosphorothioation-dependent restriction protein DptG [Amphibacillus sp.]|nr:DNA phosphorothioation-dependent restriction protein DptG [Amphibacillus sp.]